MRKRLKPAFVYPLLVLYAGTMLSGQALHQIAGCDHDHAAHAGEHDDAEHSETSSPSAYGAKEDGAGACPICRFHAQAQFGNPVVEAMGPSLECYCLAAETYVGLSMGVADSYSSRAPPHA
jgi:hypothetical protein